MLISVTQVRTGMILQIDGALFRVMKTHHVAPGNVRGAMQTTMRNLATGSKVEKRLRTTDRVERVTVESQDMEYLYADGDEYVFMHPETYEQINMHKDLLEDSLPYLLPNTRHDRRRFRRQRHRRHPADHGGFDRQHHRTRPARRHRQRLDETSHPGNRPRGPGAAVRQGRRRGARRYLGRPVRVARELMD